MTSMLEAIKVLRENQDKLYKNNSGEIPAGEYLAEFKDIRAYDSRGGADNKPSYGVFFVWSIYDEGDYKGREFSIGVHLGVGANDSDSEREKKLERQYGTLTLNAAKVYPYIEYGDAYSEAEQAEIAKSMFSSADGMFGIAQLNPERKYFSVSEGNIHKVTLVDTKSKDKKDDEGNPIVYRNVYIGRPVVEDEIPEIKIVSEEPKKEEASKMNFPF